MDKSGINKLPVGLILECGKFMYPVDLSQFSQTCKILYSLFREQRRVATLKHSGIIQRNYTLSRLSSWAVTPELACLGSDNLPSEGPASHLVLAIREGRVGALRNYLEAGVDPNSFWGYSRLLSDASCACFDKTDCIKILLEFGADSALTDADGVTTPLTRAIWNVFGPGIRCFNLPEHPMFKRDWKPEYDKVTRLIKAGIKITNTSEASNILIQVNALDVLKLAVELGTDLSKLKPTKKGLTVLSATFRHASPRSEWFRFIWPPGADDLFNNYFEIVEWLITLYPGLINICNANGESPFDLALSENLPDIARLLLFRAKDLGFSGEPWFSDFTNGETDIDKIELLLEMRQEFNNYDRWAAEFL